MHMRYGTIYDSNVYLDDLERMVSILNVWRSGMWMDQAHLAFRVYL